LRRRRGPAGIEGWILDAYVLDGEAVVWVKTRSGRLIRLTDEYRPKIYVEPREGEARTELEVLLEQSPHVRRVSEEEWSVSISRPEPRALLAVEAWGTSSLRRVVRLVRSSGLAAEVYGLMPHVQRYLFTGLGVEPTRLVRAEASGGALRKVEALDDESSLEPPPFTLFRCSFTTLGDEIRGLEAAMGSRAWRMEGREQRVLEFFAELITGLDPDLVYIPGLDAGLGRRLRASLREMGLEGCLARCGDPPRPGQGSYGGRVFLGDVFYGCGPDEYGLAGLVERARFSFTTLGLATRWTSNSCIDSRNLFELLRRRVLPPRLEYMERVRGALELLDSDRGGVTFTPRPGLHENVAALDFDSQYPSIILSRGISYESPEGGGSLIPTVLRPWLERRLWLKRLRRTLRPGSPEELYCSERVEALKLILCTQYGISGCCWNRFGNVHAFEEINRASREAMLAAKRVAEAEGYEVVYGDVDSLFVKRPGAARRDYEALASKIREATGLSISLDRHFRLIAFPPLRTDPATQALKRYFGVTFDGEVEARGIEMRRSDTPPLVREFQRRLILEVLGQGSAEQVYSSGLARGLALLRRYEELVRGRLDPSLLEVRRRLGREPHEYRSQAAQATAAAQLRAMGFVVSRGDTVGYVYTAPGHPNPLLRVRATPLHRGRHDANYYTEWLRRAAETIFNALGATLDKQEPGPRLDDWLSGGAS